MATNQDQKRRETPSYEDLYRRYFVPPENYDIAQPFEQLSGFNDSRPCYSHKVVTNMDTQQER